MFRPFGNRPNVFFPAELRPIEVVSWLFAKQEQHLISTPRSVVGGRLRYCAPSQPNNWTSERPAFVHHGQSHAPRNSYCRFPWDTEAAGIDRPETEPTSTILSVLAFWLTL